MTRGITAKKIVRYGGIVILFIVIIGYGIWRSRDVLFGITLSVTGISDGMTTTDGTLDFSGVAHHANMISVNGRIVPTAENGTWTDTIVLLPGYNVVRIVATDKFGRTKTGEYRLYYKAPATPAPQTTPETPPNTPPVLQ